MFFCFFLAVFYLVLFVLMTYCVFSFCSWCVRGLFLICGMWILLCFFCLFLLCVLMTCGWTVGTKRVWRNADQATMPSFFLFFGCSFRFLSFLCPFRFALSFNCFLPLCSMYYDIMSHLYVTYMSYICHLYMSHIYVTWLPHICHIYMSYVFHIFVTYMSHICEN